MGIAIAWVISLIFVGFVCYCIGYGNGYYEQNKDKGVANGTE